MPSSDKNNENAIHIIHFLSDSKTENKNMNELVDMAQHVDIM